MSSDRNLLEIVDLCKKLGIQLIAGGEKLRTRSPKGAMTDELRRRIAQNKAALLSLLQASEPSAAMDHGLQEAPLSLSQERLWFLDRFDGASRAFTIPLFLTLEGKLDRAALEAAVDDLVRRHGALRTVIVEQDGKARQVVPEPRPGTMEWTDLSHNSDPSAAFRALAKQTMETDFDLERGPLFRALLARLAEERHGLILVMHHIVSDRASVGIICRDLSLLYEARCEGKEISLTPAPQFADYAAWQRAHLDGDALDRDLEEAAATLSGAPALLSLPWDRPRPAVQTMHGATHRFDVPADVAESVAKLGRSCSATPFMTWLSLFGLLLSRLAGQQDLVLGCPVSSRRPETEDGVGFFVNTLVMRLNTAGGPLFLEYLRAVRDAAKESFGRRELPFERLVERLQPERSLDRNPLFQAMFVLQSSPAPRLDLPGLRTEYLPMDLGVSEFDLNLTMEPLDRGYRCFLEYSRDLFDQATMKRWAGHLLTLAREVTAAPERPVPVIPLLTAEEERVLLRDWSGAQETGPAFQSLPEAVIEQGRAAPERIAVQTPAGGTRYVDLLSRAAGVAEKLRSLNVARGDVVALLGPVDASWIAGCLGIMLTGAAFLPLDPNQPDSRLELILDDARPSAVLCAPGQQDRTPGPIPCIRPDECPLLTPGPQPMEASVRPESPAYVIYTSGSTGRPKGVRVSHGSLAFHAASVVHLFGLTPGDRALQFASPGFDVGLEEIWPTLASGGCVVVCPPGARESLEAFDLFLEEAAVSVANLPAPFWEAWTEYLAGAGRRAPASLRLLVTGSDRAASRWLPVWDDVAPGCRFLNGYGPTEAAISATFYDPERDGRWPEATCLPLGRPLPGVRAYVLDKGLRPVPAGCVGELCLAGPGVAAGYLNLPEATAGAFLEDPFVAGGRLYRTGDRARFLPGPDGRGVLHFLGRGDDQVKRRGFRIEPGEVEAALMLHKGVRKAAVVLTDSGLTALVQGPETLDSDELREALAERLPAHMIPDAILRVADLPTLPGGKLDRRAAAVLAAHQSAPDQPAFEPPRPGAEETLAEVWRTVLNVERIGRRDNFFQLGGDSIRSLRAVGLARKRGLSITPRDFFQGRTLADLALLARPVESEDPRERGPVQGEVPLTPILAWLLEQPAEMKNWLFMVLPLELTEPVERESLRTALTALFRRHDMLRLRFDGTEAETRLMILPPEESSVLAARAILPLDQRPVNMDLAEGPLFMALHAPGNRLVLLAHHACVDPVSWSVILEDLETALAQIESGENVELPAPSIPFPAWAKRLRALADEPFQRSRMGLWKRICLDTCPLAEGPGPSGPADDSSPLRGGVLLPSGAHSLSEEVMVAALALAVDRVCGRFPWLLEMEGHGRDAVPGTDAGRVVGWFTAVAPARIDLAAASDGSSLAPAAAALLAGRQAVRGAHVLGANHGLLRRVCADPAIRSSMTVLPEADVLFNYLGPLLPADRGRFQPTIGQGADWYAPIAALGLPDTPPTHPLELNAIVTPEGLRLGWERDPRRFPFPLVHDLLRALPECLQQVQEKSGAVTESTPANFPLAWSEGLDFRGLRRIQGQLDAQGLILADLHPLTPLQQGMLFHTLLDAEAGEYFDQFVCRIDLDPPAGLEHLRAAWNRVVRRHPALRSGVFWQGLDQPLQAVVRGWTLTWEEHDWRGPDDAGREAALERLLDADRVRPFDLARPPLQRLTLCRLGESAWQLVWSNHHLIIDGWSMALILEEVLHTADALARGQDPGLPPVPPFSRIAAWQERQDRETARSFWRDELAGFNAPTPLPLADQGPGETARGSRAGLALTREENDALQAGLRDRGWTLNSLAQGAWALLLSRYGGVRDVCFGASVSGRAPDVPDVERIVGCCIQTVPVRVRIEGKRRVAQWLADLRDRQPVREGHGHLGLEEITRIAHMPAGTPLFDSLLLVQNYPLGRDDRQRLVRLSDAHPIEYSNYGLTLVFAPAPEGLTITLAFDPGRFDRSRATQLLTHLRTLMLEMIRRPDASLDDLEMLTSEELRRIRDDWNGARRSYPFQGVVQEVFEQHVRRAPEAPAVLYFGKRGLAPERVLSYGDLDRRANRLAHALQARGVGPETYVGICLPRNEDLLVGVLAVLKAGGAYVPLDPDYPRDRLELMLGEVVPPVILTHEGLLERLPLVENMHALCLDRDAADLARMPESAPTCDVRPENVAFLIYTSGSTGRPKGVMALHRGLTNLVQMQTEHLQVTPKARVLQFFSPSFDGAAWEIFMALGSGAALVMAGREDLMPGPPLFEFLRRTRITHLAMTPSSLAVMPAPGPDDLPDLESLLTGGEGCDYRLAERWARGRRYFHGYGPTETTICCSAPHCTDFSGPLSLGRALPNMRMHVLDDRLRPCPVGAVGEICIGGVGVTRGYLKRPELTEERFLLDPFADSEERARGARIYRSGDLGRWRKDGVIEFAGRVDHQVKVRGYRVEPGEIENVLAGLPGVDRAVVLADQGPAGMRLLAYVTGKGSLPDPAELVRSLRLTLPPYMIPAHIIPLEHIPLTPNLKVDREALPSPSDGRPDIRRIPPSSPMQERIAAIWRELLELDDVGVDDNFFELGGHSLLTVKVCSRLNEAFDADLSVAECYEFPTIRQLAERLGDWDTPATAAVPAQPRTAARGFDPVAIVGMACRFPGAPDLAAFWDLLVQGRDGLRIPTEEEVLAAGVTRELLADPLYVRRSAMLDGYDRFDARRFGLSAREAERMDPQHRLFLETAWLALEDAALAPRSVSSTMGSNRVGVWAGCGVNDYLMQSLLPAGMADGDEGFETMTMNLPDFLAPRLAYALDLAGPAVNVQTACSTSLVAVGMACRSLQNGECDAALAGGVSLHISGRLGYLRRKGSTLAPDGICRPYDAAANGTVPGSGAGVVVLRRLEDAVAAGDPIYAVIRGVALNNDGGDKTGFAAPSARAQAEVIAEAWKAAGADPSMAGYIEGHGTGSEEGDPIEVRGLRRVFGHSRKPVLLGSVKSNIGHADAAAGIAGLIKAALCLRHDRIAPSLHFSRPAAELAGSPLQVADKPLPWPDKGGRRLAGVSSFGIGGTNCHIVMEGPPKRDERPVRARTHVFTLSAPTEDGLIASMGELARRLETARTENEPIQAAEIAWTLQAGRESFPLRKALIAANTDELQQTLCNPFRAAEARCDRVAFLLTGQGSQYPGMAAGLYAEEPAFRRAVDALSPVLEHELEVDPRIFLRPGSKDDARIEGLNDTAMAQPLLFLVAHGLVELWRSWGVHPAAMLGHSIGELVAACVAGVLSPEQGAQMAAARGRLMSASAPGAMLALGLPEDDIPGLCAGFANIGLAAVNGPRECVVSGPEEDLTALEHHCLAAGIQATRLRTSHAFHSFMMEDAARAFERDIGCLTLHPPRIPWVSNLDGAWITPDRAQDPAYWGDLIREPVRFDAGLRRLFREKGLALLEVGPANVLARLAQQHPERGETPVAASQPRPGTAPEVQVRTMAEAAARLWEAGIPLNFRAMHGAPLPGRLHLPAAPMDRQRFWIRPGEPHPSRPAK